MATGYVSPFGKGKPCGMVTRFGARRATKFTRDRTDGSRLRLLRPALVRKRFAAYAPQHRRTARTLSSLVDARSPRRPVLDSRRRVVRRPSRSRLDRVTVIASQRATITEPRPPIDVARIRSLQTLGIICGLAAGAWLGAAEAPTKLVTLGLSPVVVSLAWCRRVPRAVDVPALIQGTSYVGADLRQAPHLIVWAVLGGMSVGGREHADDLRRSRCRPQHRVPALEQQQPARNLLGHSVLQRAARSRLAPLGRSDRGRAADVRRRDGAGTLHPRRRSRRTTRSGVVAALGAGVLWGTMYIPYRKAYLTGMSPLSFITFFTVGELGMMTAHCGRILRRRRAALARAAGARAVLFWLLLGGFVWVIGDLFQQYAVKYAGITRGIPLSNTINCGDSRGGCSCSANCAARRTAYYAGHRRLGRDGVRRGVIALSSVSRAGARAMAGERVGRR